MGIFVFFVEYCLCVCVRVRVYPFHSGRQHTNSKVNDMQLLEGPAAADRVPPEDDLNHKVPSFFHPCISDMQIWAGFGVGFVRTFASA